MSDRSFQDAYARVRSRHTEQSWIALTPRQITEAIYQELRLIDAERTQQADPLIPNANADRVC
jgi:hypothetical protein